MDGYAVELFCRDHTVTNVLTQLEHFCTQYIQHIR